MPTAQPPEVPDIQAIYAVRVAGSGMRDQIRALTRSGVAARAKLRASPPPSPLFLLPRLRASA